jgi:hypothetical protein
MCKCVNLLDTGKNIEYDMSALHFNPFYIWKQTAFTSKIVTGKPDDKRSKSVACHALRLSRLAMS